MTRIDRGHMELTIALCSLAECYISGPAQAELRAKRLALRAALDANPPLPVVDPYAPLIPTSTIQKHLLRDARVAYVAERPQQQYDAEVPDAGTASIAGGGWVEVKRGDSIGVEIIGGTPRLKVTKDDVETPPPTNQQPGVP